MGSVTTLPIYETQWSEERRPLLPRRCPACHRWIEKDERCHRVHVLNVREDKARVTYMHFGRCPAPRPRRDFLEAWEATREWVWAGVCGVFGVGMILLVLLMAGWRP